MTQTVNWPNKTAGYKVVQLYLDEAPYLRFGNSDLLHGQILASFLDENGIKYRTRQSDILIPEREGDRYRAVGMGFATVVSSKKKVFLNGDSADYRIGIDAGHMRKIQESEPEWALKMI